jgi:hypothetical protein
MRWIQDNPFLAGLAAATIAGVGALIFFVLQSMGQFQEVSDQYIQAVQKLHGLQNRSPFPSKENYDKTAALAEEYKGELRSLQERLAKMQAPLNPDVKPQQFQDDLRTAVNQTVEKAAAAGVSLPKDFYLGFVQYANSLPSERAAPALARQLSIIGEIVNRLIDFKVTSIDSLDRRLLPEETPAPTEDQKKGKPVLSRLPFDLAFTAEQPKFRVVFNSLLDPKLFLIVRELSVLNSDPAGPPIAQSGANAAGTNPLANAVNPAGGAASPTSNLEVILGRELVKVSMRIEIIDFAKPEEAKK